MVMLCIVPSAKQYTIGSLCRLAFGSFLSSLLDIKNLIPPTHGTNKKEQRLFRCS